ncbi:MAG: 16S rRNA (guanine(966)-N(2))-methyltransferase RsmD [Clostridia bacterium]|nr:16S rRNA (guanine(966)-N(2))-methyltransferase RsmD [Clostridia bacterium]
MRVISGTARGRRLVTKPGEDTRPTADRVKEAVFSMLQNRIYASRVLDLFAGSGALGIEALSRGAEHAVFVEKDSEAARVVEKNLKDTRLWDKSRLIKGDALVYLSGAKESFDIIFIDPPYAAGLYGDVFSLICSGGLLAPDGIIISEHKTGCEIPVCPPLTQVSDRKYGNVSVAILKKESV